MLMYTTCSSSVIDRVVIALVLVVVVIVVESTVRRGVQHLKYTLYTLDFSLESRVGCNLLTLYTTTNTYRTVLGTTLGRMMARPATAR